MKLPEINRIHGNGPLQCYLNYFAEILRGNEINTSSVENIGLGKGVDELFGTAFIACAPSRRLGAARTAALRGSREEPLVHT